MSRVFAGVDLVLVHPGDRHGVYQGLGASLSAIETPLWAGMVATVARDAGLRVAVVDAEAENLSPHDVAERVRDLHAGVAAVVVYGHQPNASTQNMTMAEAVARSVREVAPLTRTLLLGGHVAALPELTLRDGASEFVAVWEGVYTAVALAFVVRDGALDPYGVPGLGWRGAGAGGEVVLNQSPRLMPTPARCAYDLLPMGLYRAHNHHVGFGALGPRTPYASIYTSLGCPYGCGFCPIQAPFRSGEAVAGLASAANSYRRMPPAEVVATVDHLVDHYGVTTIRISDELFILNRGHVSAICHFLAGRPYADRLNLWCYARIDTIHLEDLGLLRDAGVRWICYGIESADQEVLDSVGKGYAAERTAEVVAATELAGIEVQANYIVGLPLDTVETVAATRRQCVELGTAAFNVYSAMAYPGSRLYNEAVASGTPLPAEWIGYSQHAWETTPLPTASLTSAEVLRLRDEFHVAVAGSSEYLSGVRRRFGPAAADHVAREMTGRLPRRLLGDPRPSCETP